MFVFCHIINIIISVKLKLCLSNCQFKLITPKCSSVFLYFIHFKVSQIENVKLKQLHIYMSELQRCLIVFILSFLGIFSTHLIIHDLESRLSRKVSSSKRSSLAMVASLPSCEKIIVTFLKILKKSLPGDKLAQN